MMSKWLPSLYTLYATESWKRNDWGKQKREQAPFRNNTFVDKNQLVICSLGINYFNDLISFQIKFYNNTGTQLRGFFFQSFIAFFYEKTHIGIQFLLDTCYNAKVLEHNMF